MPTPSTPSRLTSTTAYAKMTSYEIVNTSGKRVTDIAAIEDSRHGSQAHRANTQLLRWRCLRGLPLGQVGKFGAVTRTESLVLTEKILQRSLRRSKFRLILSRPASPPGPPITRLNFVHSCRTRAGYTFHAGSPDPSDPEGYFVNAGRRRYDFQTCGRQKRRPSSRNPGSLARCSSQSV